MDVTKPHACIGLGAMDVTRVPERPTAKVLEWSPSYHRDLLCIVKPNSHFTRPNNNFIISNNNFIITSQNLAKAEGPITIL